MTISTTSQRNDYLGNNSTATYSFSFQIFDPSHLRVIQRDTSGNETVLALTTDFTVSPSNSYPSVGTITLIAGNLALNYTLTILREVPLCQSTSIRDQGDFFPEVHEKVFDYLTEIDQQQQNSIDGSLKLPDSICSGNFCMTLPTAICCSPSTSVVVNPTCNGWVMGPTTTQIANAQGYACVACNCAAAAAASASTAANCASTSSSCAGLSAACAAVSATCAGISANCAGVAASCANVSALCAACSSAYATTSGNCATLSCGCANVAAGCAGVASSCAASAATSATNAAVSAVTAGNCATLSGNCSVLSCGCANVSALCAGVAASCVGIIASCAALAASCATTSAACAAVSATCANVSALCAACSSAFATASGSCATLSGNCSILSCGCANVSSGCANVASSCAAAAATSATNAAASATTSGNCATLSGNCSVLSCGCANVSALCAGVSATCAAVSATCANVSALCAAVSASCALFAKNCVSVLGAFGGDSGSGGTQGLVPAPPAGATAAGDFLSSCGGWCAPPTGKNLVRCVIMCDQTFTTPSNICWLTVRQVPINHSQIATSYDGLTTPTFAIITSSCCLYTWGSGQCGIDGQAAILPTCVPTVVNCNVLYKSVSLGELIGAAIDWSGQIYTWGSNAQGGLANGNITSLCSPTLLACCSALKWKQASAGVGFILALSCNGDAYASGNGVNGATGLGCTGNTCQFTIVCCGIKYQRIRASNNNAGGIDLSGIAWMWGRGDLGILGNCTSTSTANCVPHPVCLGCTFKSLSMGEQTAGGVTCDGTALVWGNACCGSFGNGTTTHCCVPTVVCAAIKFIQWEVGQRISAGIDVCGNLWTTGANICGSLGIGSITPQCTLQQVCAGTKWKHVSVLSCSMMATTLEGATYVWGASSCGMGNGTTTASCTPVLVSCSLIAGIIYPQTARTYFVQPSTTYCVSIWGGFPAFESDPIVQDFSTNYLVIEYFS